MSAIRGENHRDIVRRRETSELGRERAARCPSCSQNAHGETVLAWDKSTSLGKEAVLADSGRAGEVVARVGRVRKLRAGTHRLGQP